MEQFIALMIVMVLSLLVGVLIGSMHKGFTININRNENQVPAKKEYNPVHLDTMNEEDRAYLEKNKGKIHF